MEILPALDARAKVCLPDAGTAVCLDSGNESF